VTIPATSPAVAARSGNQQVLAAWAAGLAAVARYADRARQVLAAAQASAFQPAFAGGGQAGRLAGLAVPPGAGLPPGWRADAGLGLAVPDPDVAAGRWVAAALADAGYPGGSWQWLPGLPPGLAAAAEVPGWRAALSPDGSVLYAGCDLPTGGQPGWGPFDRRLWSPVSLGDDAVAAAAWAAEAGA